MVDLKRPLCRVPYASTALLPIKAVPKKSNLIFHDLLVRENSRFVSKKERG